MNKSSAADIIADALTRARAEGTSRIGDEHLFAALLAHPDTRHLFGKLGGPAEAAAVQTEVRDARRQGGLTVAERAALTGLGIDLDKVVAQAESRLGRGALASAPAHRTRRASMTPEAVGVLHAAQRYKTARGDRRTNASHLALGLLTHPGLFADALAARGITAATAAEAIEGHPRKEL